MRNRARNRPRNKPRDKLRPRPETTLQLPRRAPLPTPPMAHIDRSRPPTMVDPQQAIEKARKAVTERAELPGMSLMEHLDELRKRIVHSAIFLAVGFFVAFYFREKLYGLVQAPLTHLGIKLNSTHPMD